jgi:hypothetical protein
VKSVFGTKYAFLVISIVMGTDIINCSKQFPFCDASDGYNSKINNGT